MAAGPAGEPERKRDPRYSTKYKYRYDDRGRQVEVQRYRNDGRLAGRTVRNYKDGQVETLAYNADGELVDKRVETLDAKGNAVEVSYFDVKSDTVRTRYSYTYDSFDAQGNWVKKTTAKWVTKEGKSFFEPSYVTYRAITYY
jgi:acylphosphatase